MSETIFDLVKKRVVLMDGGLGTEFMKLGLPQGTCPELWNVERPEVVRNVHQSYYEAGSDAVSTNSFGGNRIKLSSHHLEARCAELNRAAARLALETRPAGRLVAGSIGPTGKFLKPQGKYVEKDFEEVFAEQALALTEGGVDFLLIETMFDLREALCALQGAKRVSSLPVFATVTFNRTRRGFFTLMGDGVARCLGGLEENGAGAVGTNCTLNSADMADLVAEMKKATLLPIIAQPNAGQPELDSKGGLSYSQEVEDYLREFPRLIRNGARIVGGCCGTNSEYIRRIAVLLKTI